MFCVILPVCLDYCASLLDLRVLIQHLFLKKTIDENMFLFSHFFSLDMGHIRTDFFMKFLRIISRHHVQLFAIFGWPMTISGVGNPKVPKKFSLLQQYQEKYELRVLEVLQPINFESSCEMHIVPILGKC